MNNKLRTKENLRPYQRKASLFQMQHPNSVLRVDKGLGKTAITLMSIHTLQSMGEVGPVLIVAPLRVVHLVWRQEAKKWAETSNLKFSVITGTLDQRSRALLRPADVYLTNYENLKWIGLVIEQHFIKKGRKVPFNGLVWDELSKMKNSGSQRVKVFKNILKSFVWVTGLTGGLIPNGISDLYSQYLVVDGGKRLGSSFHSFQKKYLTKEGYRTSPKPGATDSITEAISDITLEMSAADYLSLPPMITNRIVLTLPPSLQEKYDELENEFFLQLREGVCIEVLNNAALALKLLQFANGSVYPESGVSIYEEIHDLKIEALREILEDSGDTPVLCAYSFKSDADRIRKTFPDCKPLIVSDHKTDRSSNAMMSSWKSGECKLLLAHPLSAGHGIDGLQGNGSIVVWFGMNWSYDLYSQLNARLVRSGQTKPVVCYHIVFENTYEMVQESRCLEKGMDEKAFQEVLKNYILEKRKV